MNLEDSLNRQLVLADIDKHIQKCCFMYAEKLAETTEAPARARLTHLVTSIFNEFDVPHGQALNYVFQQEDGLRHMKKNWK